MPAMPGRVVACIKAVGGNAVLVAGMARYGTIWHVCSQAVDRLCRSPQGKSPTAGCQVPYGMEADFGQWVSWRIFRAVLQGVSHTARLYVLQSLDMELKVRWYQLQVLQVCSFAWNYLKLFEIVHDKPVVSGEDMRRWGVFYCFSMFFP